MDTPKWQSVVAARKLIEGLRQLNSHLPSLRSDLHEIKHSAESIDKQTKAYHDEERPPQEMAAILHEPKSAEDERHSRNTRTQRRDRISLLVEVFTLISVSFYGYMAIRQWREMIAVRHQAQSAISAANRSARAAEKANAAAFEADRPWIGPVFANDKDTGFHEIPNTSQYHYSYIWHFKNAGKRPAIMTQIHTTGGWFKECTMHPHL